MFRLNRNERSHWSGNGVHVESELVFMIGRNMHLVRFGRQAETEIIERQRGGWRLFKTIDAAVQTAKNIGFRRVEIDVSGMRD